MLLAGRRVGPEHGPSYLGWMGLSLGTKLILELLLEQCPPKELIRQELSRSACRLAGVAEALWLPGRRQVHHADSQQFIPEQDRVVELFIRRW